KYFNNIFNVFSHPNIYNKYVCLPHVDDPTPPEILHDPRFYPAFQSAIGAINGTHIICCPSAVERGTSCHREGFLSQNCLVCCSFDLKFTYVLEIAFKHLW
ncbi:hypothetical protein PAXRUDRAFT_139571, partial [Paxillus rubicundulus Ve08.2h10]